MFTIKCHQCGDQNPIGNDEMSSVHVYFEKGSPNIMDRMVLYCGNCGNKEEHGISWPLERCTQTLASIRRKP
jgi:NMD protein affecting ribosome stability and mRNA decay